MLDPVVGVHVFDHVAATILEGFRAEKRAEADDLLMSLVAAVIEDNIERSELPANFCEKRRVRLATDPDEDVLAFAIS